jgi:hypothetical protein
MALNDSLARGVAAMQGQGVDPRTLYGIPPAAAPPVGAFSAPSGAVAGGAPSSPAGALYGLGGAPAPGGPPAGPMATAAAPGAGVPSSGGAGAFNAVAGGAASTAPTALGGNAFGVHPDVNLHQLTDYLLPKVRDVESTGNYKADRASTHPGQTASGAYQYTDSTWNGYQGYKRAVDAPPEVQDAKAKEDFMQRLQASGGDPFKAVAGHYFPRFAHDPSKWNEPLTDSRGNAIKGAEPVANYVSRVLPADRVKAYLASQGGAS